MVKIENYFRFFAILLPILAIATVGAILYYEYVVVFEGKIKNVGVTLYWDVGLTEVVPENTPLTELGNLTLGQNNHTIYVKNTGWYDVNITWSNSWTVSAPNNVSLTITWDSSNWPDPPLLTIGESRAFNFTVEVTNLTETIPEDIDYTIILTIRPETYET